MSRKDNCIDNGVTEQVFDHIKDEFFRGRSWTDVESFKSSQNLDGSNKSYAIRGCLRNSSRVSPFSLTWRLIVFQWAT